MIIRSYEPSDCEYLAELFYQTVHTVNAKDYTDEQLDAWADGSVELKQWNRTFLEHFSVVAVIEDRIVGFGDIDTKGYLDRLYVHKDYQNKGVATAICKELEGAVEADKITVHASITAKPFFLSRGYKVVKEQQVCRKGIFLKNFLMEKDVLLQGGFSMERCPWCLCNEKMIKYHDEEWGVPLHEDKKQFEFLMMEVMQCGLNWNMMIQKRDIFRQCFDGFDYEKVAAYTQENVRKIMETKGMIRSQRKIEAVIHNARCFLKVRGEFGTFSAYLWGFSGEKTIVYKEHQKSGLPAKNDLSDIISRDLKKRGFKYLGSVTVYSHLQACGIINDHLENCFRYKEVMKDSPIIYK